MVLQVIVDHSQTRRTINGNFNLIGTPDNLRMIAEQILAQVGTHDNPAKWTYGTVHITEPHRGVSNVAPKAWDE